MIEAALARFRARWAHPPVDRRDVEERVALRLVDGRSLEVVVLATPPTCRLFVRHGERWRSRYVHAIGEVDAALDALAGGAR